MFGKKASDKPIDCEAVQTHLERYVDGRFPPTTLAAFDEHLATCAACRRLVREEPDWLNQLRYEPPHARLSAEETAAMRQQLYGSMKRRMFIRQTTTVLQTAMALVLLVLVVGLIAWWQQGDDWVPISGPDPLTAEGAITLAASPSFQTAYKLLIDQFQEEHPHLRVQFLPLSPEQAGLSLHQQATLADVILLEGMPPTTDATAAFLDLTPLIAADPTFDDADFWPGLMEACQAAGVQVGLPFRTNASLIFFDKAAFDAAGLPHPEPGWRWEDFRQAVQALAVRDGAETTRYGFTDNGNPLGLLAPLADHVIGASDGALDGRDLAAELAWYVILVDENVILSDSNTPVNSLLNQRQVGMWIGSHFGLLGARSALGDELGIAPFPTAAGMSQSNPVTAGCALISAGTNQSQTAWTFLNYLSRQALFATGYYPAAPARPSVAQSSDYWGQMGPEAAVALQAALEQGWYRRAEMPELVTVGKALTQALAGAGSLAENLPDTMAIQPTAQPPPPGNEPLAVATPPVTLPLDPDVITIEYSVRGHDDWEAVIALAEAFNESQNRIRVNTTTRLALPQGDTLVEQADLFDCFLNGTRPDAAFEQLGDPFLAAFYSLSPLFNAEDPVFRSDFTLMSKHLRTSTVAGELYALPVALYPVVLRYNATLLAQRGIDPPSADWTIEDFWVLVQAAGSGPAYGLVAVEGILPDELLSFVPGAATYFNPDTWPMEPEFTDPAVIAALEFLGRMAEEGILYPDTEWASRRTVMEDLAVRGQAAATANLGRAAVWGHAVAPGAGGGSRVASGVVAYPQTTRPNLSGNEGGGQPMMLYISRRSPDPTACWEWFKFLTAQPDAFLGIPARQSVRESAAWREVVGEETAVAYETTYSRPPGWELDMGWETFVYRTWWADALLSVYEGGDPARALAEAQRRAEVFYDCYAPQARQLYPDLPTFSQVRECAQQADPDYQR
jgi:ABC-type glycerol-3-phosphate transport system substrate-binding protein